MNAASHPVDRVLPRRQMLTLGLQHMLVAYIGAIAVPLIVASALKMSPADTTVLISTALFCSGISTILQTVGVWKLGVRLPILQGVAFSSVGPVIAIGLTPGVGFAGVCGAVIGAGIITTFAAPLVGRLRRLFPPVVTGCIVTVIGLQLFPVAYQWAGGGDAAKLQFGELSFLAVALVVAVVILAVNRFANAFLRNLSVLIGLVAGSLLAIALGMGNFTNVAAAPWFTVPYPFHFGTPVFAIVPVLTMVVVMIVQMVESMGLFVAIGDIVEKQVSEEDVVRGLRANGVASAIAGTFAAFPFIAFMENVGLVILTGVRSRWIVAVSGVLMCVVALVPKIGAIVASTPSAALGGARRCRYRDVRRGGRRRRADAREGRLRRQPLQRADRRLHDRNRADSGDGAEGVRAHARLDAAVPAQRRRARVPRVGAAQRAAQRCAGGCPR